MKGRFLRDFRYALRTFRRNPAFFTMAVGVLAVGIGVNTAAFGLIDALLLKPLPVRDPDALVRVSATAIDGAVSYADLLDCQAGLRSLSGLAAFTADTLALRLGGEGAPERVGAYLVSSNYFEVLGAEPRLGRGLSAAPGGGAPGIVLSDDYWRRRFGGDERVLGRAVWLNGHGFVVAGVAPARFTGTLRGGGPQVYVAYADVVPRADLEERRRRTLIAVGRLAPGQDLAAAQAELRVIGQRLAAAFPESNRGVSLWVGRESTAIFREAPQLAYVVIAVLGMFALLLMVACANLAGLLTARATVRRQEIAIRTTQGATARVIVVQLLTESLALALVGGLAGLFVGVVARNVLWNRLQHGVARHLGLDAFWIDTRVDLRVLLFTLAVSLSSVVIFGLMPALHASKPDLYGRAGESPASPLQLTRLRRLVVAQVTISVVLLACAGLLFQTVRNAAAADLGYPLDRAYVADLDLSGIDDGQKSWALASVLRSVRELPGVEAAALATGGGPGYLPQSMTPGRARQNYVLSSCGPSFFRTLRIPVRSGREFTENDTRESPRVAILNQRLAQALWPGEDAVGRQLRLQDGAPLLTVVGVVKTVRSFPIGPPFFQLYLPLAQQEPSRATLHVRTAEGTDPLFPGRLAQELRRAPAGVAAIRVRALTEWVGSILAVPRTMVGALGSLGAAALLLAAIGLYGITAYTAGRRLRECAVRQALGASRSSIFWLLVRGSMKTIVLSLVAGSAIALSLGFLLKAVLLGAAFDPVALVAAPCLLCAAAGAAVAWPAFRATSVDAMTLLREE